jgi:hypothetical protein
MVKALLVAALFLQGCTVTAFADLSAHAGGRPFYSVAGHPSPPGPLIRVGAEAMVPVTDNISIALGAEHRSYPTFQGDRGEERVYAGARLKFVVRP